MMKTYIYVMLGVAVWLMESCSHEVKITERSEEFSPLVDEYANVVLPPNIASLNFFVEAEDGQEALVLTCGDQRITALNEDGAIIPDLDDWKRLMSKAGGKQIQVEHCVRTTEGWKAYQPFVLQVAEETIDPYLAYRLVPPGYVMWNEMGIYQRNLENFEETAILTNRQTDRNCMNCHSFCMQNPEKMMFHLRAKHAGTMLIDEGNITKLDTKTENTISALVYPYWHPGGKYIAFSVNETKQLFHSNHRNRVEVMDLASDVVVYDVEKNEVVTVPQLFDENVFETFPSFSPDGKTLYYCAASRQSMPDDVDKLKYHLCAIGFDADSRTFGNRVDTIFHAVKEDKSVSFPRVSPDGKHLMFTLADNATFPIWHQEADLWMLDMQSGKRTPLDVLNSESADSYHCWSSNSHWVVFSSRRMDKLYTRPYIAYVYADGTVGKPFVLPQSKGDFYDKCMYSYNIPELVKGKVDVSPYELTRHALGEEKKQVVSGI